MTIVRNEIRTGLLVIITLAALIAGMLYLGAPGTFVAQNTYRVFVENAAGVKQGAQVMLAGRKVGQVVNLSSPVAEAERPQPKLETLVEIKVARKARIYKEVKVMLTQNGLLGESMIDFTSGHEASGLAPDGMAFIAERPASIDQAVPLVLDRIDPALNKVTETLKSLQFLADNISRLVAEGGEVQTTIAEFRQFGTNLDAMSGPTGPLQKTLFNLQTMLSDEGKLGKTLTNVEALTGEESSFAKTMKNAEKFTGDLTKNKDIERTLRNLREATTNLNGTIDGIGEKFSRVGSNLEQASDTVKHQPWRLIYPTTKKYPDDQSLKEQIKGTAPRAPVKKPATPRRKAS